MFHGHLLPISCAGDPRPYAGTVSPAQCRSCAGRALSMAGVPPQYTQAVVCGGASREGGRHPSPGSGRGLCVGDGTWKRPQRTGGTAIGGVGRRKASEPEAGGPLRTSRGAGGRLPGPCPVLPGFLYIRTEPQGRSSRITRHTALQQGPLMLHCHTSQRGCRESTLLALTLSGGRKDLSWSRFGQ